MRPRAFSRHAQSKLPKIRQLKETVRQIQPSEAEISNDQTQRVHGSVGPALLNPCRQLTQNLLDMRSAFAIMRTMSVSRIFRLFYAVSSADAFSPRLGASARLPGHGIEGPDVR